MKRYLFFASCLFVIAACSCSGEKKSGAGRPQVIYPSGGADTAKDSIVYYDTEIKTRQKSYQKELEGRWNITSMKRQQKMDAETIPGAFIEFRADSSFSGRAVCNSFGGKYTLKGTSIKFGETRMTEMACENMEKETAFFRLLQQTVSAYSVENNTLFLRDGSSNIVFACSRVQ